MTNNELYTIFDEQVKRCEAVLLHKGKEYAPDETDRLSSFKAAAALLHCTQPKALCGMLAKHIVSVYDMWQPLKTPDVQTYDKKGWYNESKGQKRGTR